MVRVDVLHDPAIEPSRPYSAGLVAGSFIFLAGQVGYDPRTDSAGSTIEDQTRMALENMRRVLRAGGADLDSVVNVTVFLTRQDHSSGMNAVYREFFDDPLPARTTVVVAALGQPDLLIEIQAVAYVGP